MDGAFLQLAAGLGLLEHGAKGLPVSNEGDAVTGLSCWLDSSANQGLAVLIQIVRGDVEPLEGVVELSWRKIADEVVKPTEPQTELVGLRCVFDPIHAPGVLDEAHAAPDPTLCAAVPRLVPAVRWGDQAWVLPAAVSGAGFFALNVGLHGLEVPHHLLRAGEHGCVEPLEDDAPRLGLHQEGVIDIAAPQGADPQHRTRGMKGFRRC